MGWRKKQEYFYIGFLYRFIIDCDLPCFQSGSKQNSEFKSDHYIVIVVNGGNMGDSQSEDK